MGLHLDVASVPHTTNGTRANGGFLGFLRRFLAANCANGPHRIAQIAVIAGDAFAPFAQFAAQILVAACRAVNILAAKRDLEQKCPQFFQEIVIPSAWLGLTGHGFPFVPPARSGPSYVVAPRLPPAYLPPWDARDPGLSRKPCRTRPGPLEVCRRCSVPVCCKAQDRCDC